MRLMSPFIFMDKRNFLNGRYVCIAKLQFIPAAFIPAAFCPLLLVMLQLQRAMQLCRKCNVPIYPYNDVQALTKPKVYNSWINGLLLQNVHILLFFIIEGWYRQMHKIEIFCIRQHKNIQNTAAVFSIDSLCI